MWLSIIKSLVGITEFLTKYFADKQLIDLGMDRMVRNNLEDTSKTIQRAIEIRRAAKREFNRDKLRDDPNNRD